MTAEERKKQKEGQYECNLRHGVGKKIYDPIYEKMKDDRRGCRDKCLPGQRVKEDHSGCRDPLTAAERKARAKMSRQKSSPKLLRREVERLTKEVKRLQKENEALKKKRKRMTISDDDDDDE